MHLTKQEIAFLFNMFSINLTGYNPIVLNMPERVKILDKIREEYTGLNDHKDDLNENDLNYLSWLLTTYGHAEIEHVRELHHKIEKMYKDLTAEKEAQN